MTSNGFFQNNNNNYNMNQHQGTNQQSSNNNGSPEMTMMMNNMMQQQQMVNNSNFVGQMPPSSTPGTAPTWGVKVNRKYRQLRKSLKTCKHFEDNYFVLELNSQQASGSTVGQSSHPQKPKTSRKGSSETSSTSNDGNSADDANKKAAFAVPYKEQVQLMSEFSVAPTIEDEVVPLSKLNRNEESTSEPYMKTPSSISSSSSGQVQHFTIMDKGKKKRKNLDTKEPKNKLQKHNPQPFCENQETNLLPNALIDTSSHSSPSTLLSTNLNPNPLLTINNPMLNSSVTPDNFSNIQQLAQIRPELLESIISPQNPSLIHTSRNILQNENPIHVKEISQGNNSIFLQRNNMDVYPPTTKITVNPNISPFPIQLTPSTTNNDAPNISATPIENKLPSISSVDSFFKADITDTLLTAPSKDNLIRNNSATSEFLKLEDIPEDTKETKTTSPVTSVLKRSDSKPSSLTRCMSHTSLSLLDTEEDDEPTETQDESSSSKFSRSISSDSMQVPIMEESAPITSSHKKEIVMEKDQLVVKSPFITPLNAVLYKNVSVSNMDLLKLDVPSVSTFKNQDLVGSPEKDHSHWIQQIQTLPSNDSLVNLASMVEFNIYGNDKK